MVGAWCWWKGALVEDTLTEALEREHHEIDAGLEACADGLAVGVCRSTELARAATALRRHIYLEEEFLFPPLRAAGMLAPVLVMLREHGEIWRLLESLEQEAAAVPADSAPPAVPALPADSALSADSALQRCRELLEALARHNAKEEPIIYPQGDVVLSPEAKEELHAFLQEGTMPSDWVCEQAS